MATTQTYQCKVTWSGKQFAKAVEFARKRCDGVYDVDSKVWVIRKDCALLRVETRQGTEPIAFLASHGLQVVD